MATSAGLQMQHNQKCIVETHHSGTASNTSQPVVLRYTRDDGGIRVTYGASVISDPRTDAPARYSYSSVGRILRSSTLRISGSLFRI
jgi:hypothetical protein